MFEPLIPSVSPLLAAAAVGGAAPDSLINFVPLIPAIPLAGFVFTAFFGRRMGRPAFVLPLLGVTVTWLLSMAVVYQALTGGHANPEGLADAKKRLAEAEHKPQS